MTKKSTSQMASPHIVLFPYMAKGHTIPILHLARLLIRRGATVTIFTTPGNQPFISKSLSDVNPSIIDLPFPENIAGLPPGVESTDQLPDISMWVPLARATKLIQPHFERALQILPRVTFMVTDGFLWWTVDSAAKFGIPRLVYYGMSIFASTMARVCSEAKILEEIESDDEVFPAPHFPWVKLTRDDFEPVFRKPDPGDPLFQIVMDCTISTSKSYGLVENSFYQLEQVFIDYSNSDSNFPSRQFCVGPLCLAERSHEQLNGEHKKPTWIQWLDQKLDQGKPVLYVAFGSQADISPGQLEEIKDGLEKSQVNFLWVGRRNKEDEGFEERVKDRGLIVKEWVNQREILGHESVQGFLSHCGWNSVIESVCARVPILAWPLMAEQHLNARFVVDVIKIGVMAENISNGTSLRGFVKSEGLEKSVRELMEGEKGKSVRKKVKELGEAAIRAMEEGGSSWNQLNSLLDELHAKSDS